MGTPEPWLAGPLEGISPMLTPAAHALMQSRDDLEKHTAGLSLEQLWHSPGGAPPVGFHLRHIDGSIDRLLAYAEGRSLTKEQFRFLAAEREPEEPRPDAKHLVTLAQARIDFMLDALRRTPDATLFDARTVGRAQLPTNVFGLLFHIAEHTQRHTGQVIATAKMARANP
jgi:hypothetical protein